MKFKEITDSLGIDKTFNKESRTRNKRKKTNSVDQNITHEARIQLEADVLHLPASSSGNKYLLVVVDLATRMFDIEPIQVLNSKNCLEALKEIEERDYIGELEAPEKLTTDGGAEFKGTLHNYLYDNNIFHRFTSAGRSNQLSVINNLCKQLGRLFMGYLNTVNQKNKKGTRSIYSDWDDIIDEVREELNKFRERKLPKHPTLFKYEYFNPITEPTYNVGDYVYRRLDKNEDVFGYKWSDHKTRAGDFTIDRVSRKVVKIIYMNDNPYYRYILEGLPNIAFYDYQLIKSNVEYSTEIVKTLIDRRRNKAGVLEYLIQFRNETKREALKNKNWQTIDELKEQDLDIYIDAYDDIHPFRPRRKN